MFVTAGEATTASLVSHEQVLLALIALVGTSIAALVYIIRNGRIAQVGLDHAETAAQQATAANAAVNNVGPGQHKLYDMMFQVHTTNEQLLKDVTALVEAQRDFTKRGWANLPEPINTALGLTTTILDLQRHAEDVNGKLDTIIGELRGHVEWEMQEKYGSHDESG